MKQIIIFSFLLTFCNSNYSNRLKNSSWWYYDKGTYSELSIDENFKFYFYSEDFFIVKDIYISNDTLYTSNSTGKVDYSNFITIKFINNNKIVIENAYDEDNESLKLSRLPFNSHEYMNSSEYNRDFHIRKGNLEGIEISDSVYILDLDDF